MMFVYTYFMLALLFLVYMGLLRIFFYSNQLGLLCDVWLFSSGSLIFSEFNSSCVPCPHSCVGHILFAVMFAFVILPNIMVCFSNYGHFWACGLRNERDSSPKN